jgi:hypothetical protein
LHVLAGVLVFIGGVMLLTSAIKLDGFVNEIAEIRGGIRWTVSSRAYKYGNKLLAGVSFYSKF